MKSTSLSLLPNFGYLATELKQICETGFTLSKPVLVIVYESTTFQMLHYSSLILTLAMLLVLLKTPH